MGCDGGTIPKRKEIVKSKQKDLNRDKNADRSAKWQFCALSGLRLKEPIVACQLGRMYNKTAIIEHLLELKTATRTEHNPLVSHIKSLRDVKEIKLKEKAEYDERNHQASSGSEKFKAQFVCPISGLDMNGSYKFFYNLQCGCVLSERAIKEVPNESSCILCSKHYESDLDLILLNASDEDELDELKERLELRRKRHKDTKKHSRSAASSNDQPTTSNGSGIYVKDKHRHLDLGLNQKRFKSEKVP